MGNNIYLDCSGLHNVRLDGSDIPKFIQIDGFEFLQRFESIVEKLREHDIIEVNISEPNPADLNKIKISIELLKAKSEINEIKSHKEYYRDLSLDVRQLINKTERLIDEQITKLNK